VVTLGSKDVSTSLEESAATAAAIAELNRRRLRVLGPLMACLHLAHVIFFHVPPSLRATLPAATLRWRDGLVAAHAATLPAALLLTWLAYRQRDRRITRWLPPAAALLYLVHGAVVASLDQIVSANISAYIGYCIGIAVTLSLPPPLAIPIYAIAEATMIAGLFMFQREASRLTNLPTSLTVALVSIATSWMLHNSRRRDLKQRAIIDRQREELTTLNASLSERVREQVQEIVARADEVERLNAQLQAQVVARSGELSLALARLAGQRDSDGTLARGFVLGGRFVIEEPIGKGGMGAVYAGVDRTSGKRVALKVIQASSSRQLDAMRRFIREAGAVATVSHPAIVRMLHLDITDDGLLFQAQELVDGQTLHAHATEPWPAATAARVGQVLCDALAAAHALGIVHRDVKPDNVMLTATAPGLKLLDFGIAKLYDAVTREPDGTAARMIIGTPGYMAPEQALGARDVTDRADVYAVGVMLHQLVSARLPAPEPLETPPVTVAPPAFAALVTGCLVGRPSARPSAGELARELARFADGEQAPPLEAIARLRLAASPLAAGSEASIPTTPRRRST
jgi:hypothetical protein